MNLIQLFTNENQIILKILAFFVIATEWLLFYKTSSILLDIKGSKKQCLLFIFVNCIISGLINLLPNNLISDIFNLVQFIFSMHFVFKQSIKSSFLALIFSYVGAILSGYISETILMSLLRMDFSTLMTIPIYYLGTCLFSSTIWAFILLIINLIKKHKPYNLLKITINRIVFINLILGITTIALESYLLSIYTDLISLELTIIIIITLLLYFSVSLYSIIRTNKLEKTQADLENEITYNKTLTLMHDNIRSFKHDFNNIVQSIGGYIELNDMNGLKDYYKRLLEECKITNNLNLLNPETINNPSIYSLLTNKYYIAQQKNININFSIFTDLSKINFNMYELTRILGILLDNAIEAAEETEEKIINVEFISDSKKQLFIIKNSCKDSNISTTKIFEKGYSTKNRNSGIGLWKVHKILSKNTNLDLFTTVKDNIFSQQLEIFY